MAPKTIESYLPLTESTFYILLALIEPKHGYGVMQWIEGKSAGHVIVGAGTLYNAFSALLKEGLIIKTDQDERRKYYGLTIKGKKILLAQIERLGVMFENGQQVRDLLAKEIAEKE